MIADDSESVRQALRRLLGDDPEIEVVGEAPDGVAAVDMAIELEPHVITMDVRMPRLDGLGAIAAIMAHSPTRILVVCDTSKSSEMDLSFRAVSAGAIEFIPKPRSGEPIRQWGHRLVESVRLMADIPVVRRRQGSVPRLADLLETGDRAVDVWGIVASTGGPPALAELVGALPADFPVPLVVAQHMAPGFAKGLVNWLAQGSRLRVKLTDDRAPLEPGTVYLPPDGDDIMVDRYRRVRTPPGEGLHCPSGNRLLDSLAEVFGGRAGGIVLTGMGDDGARGLLRIREAGGVTMAQDESSSVVYGMPGAAVQAGAARDQFPIEHIAIKMMQIATSDGR
jgi:two-component system chemotaxis response regulator CheB